MRTETSNMKPNEPSRTALIIARQRAAHQVPDHGSILYDPFAMKILREDEKDVLQFANEHLWFAKTSYDRNLVLVTMLQAFV